MNIPSKLALTKTLNGLQTCRQVTEFEWPYRWWLLSNNFKGDLWKEQQLWLGWFRFGGENKTEAFIIVVVIIIIVIYFDNSTFLHAKLGSDVCPRVDNQTSGNTLQDLTRPLVQKLPSASYPPMGIGASFRWRDALPHTNQLGLGMRHWNLETSSVVVEFPPPYRNAKNKIIQVKQKYSKIVSRFEPVSWALEYDRSRNHDVTATF